MITLGIDTALRDCSVGLLRDGVVVAEDSTLIGGLNSAAVGGKVDGLGGGHAELLPTMVARILRDASVAPQEIDRIGVVVGPGAFAGVRVGLAFARAFSLGLKAACIGVTSLEALAASAFPERQTPDIASAEARRTYYVAPVIDARRGQVYAALYDAQGAAIVDPFVAAPDAALETITASMGASAPKPDAGEAKVFILGDGAGLIDGPPDWRRLERLAIDPSMVARMAMAKEVMATRPAPLYLRPPDAKAPQQSLFAGLVAGDTLSESGKG